MAHRRDVIAIVDDDPAVRTSMKRLLELFGYRIESYGSGGEFVSAAARTEATCLIVDMEPGDMSGLDFARQLSALGFSLPIIFITGSTDDALRRQAMALHCTAYLQKPVRAQAVIEAVKKALRSDTTGNNP